MSQCLMDTNAPPNAQQSDESPPRDSSSSTLVQPMFPEVHRESAVSPLAQTLMGPQGLYPGARWLIYLAMGLVALALFNSVSASLRPYLSNSLWWRMGEEVSMMLAAILPGFVMARVEGRAFGDFGLPAKLAFGRNFWLGALWGLSSLTALILMLRMLGAFSFGGLAQHGGRILKFGLFWAVFFLFAALFEDFLMRGYSQWVLTKGMNFWPAAAVLSIMFGAIHLANPGETKIGIAGVIAIGFFFCLTLWRTGNLWWAIGFHMAWDWGESFLYSVPDSGSLTPGHLLNSWFNGPVWLTGGSVGPEGSYMLFVVLGAVWVLFDRAYPDVKYNAQQENL
jgi:uncharacterized protein